MEKANLVLKTTSRLEPTENLSITGDKEIDKEVEDQVQEPGKGSFLEQEFEDIDYIQKF